MLDSRQEFVLRPKRRWSGNIPGLFTVSTRGKGPGWTHRDPVRNWARRRLPDAEEEREGREKDQAELTPPWKGDRDTG